MTVSRGDVLQGTALTALLLVLRRYSAGASPPSVREVARAAGVRVKAAQDALTKLRRLGLVAWEPGRARTVVPACRLVLVGGLP